MKINKLAQVEASLNHQSDLNKILKFKNFIIFLIDRNFKFLNFDIHFFKQNIDKRDLKFFEEKFLKYKKPDSKQALKNYTLLVLHFFSY